jgi:hypothetical protein
MHEKVSSSEFPTQIPCLEHGFDTHGFFFSQFLPKYSALKFKKYNWNKRNWIDHKLRENSILPGQEHMYESPKLTQKPPFSHGLSAHTFKVSHVLPV